MFRHAQVNCTQSDELAECTSAPHCRVETLQALLAMPSLPTPPQLGDAAAARRLQLAGHVYNAWTSNGAEPAQLADR